MKSGEKQGTICQSVHQWLLVSKNPSIINAFLWCSYECLRKQTTLSTLYSFAYYFLLVLHINSGSFTIIDVHHDPHSSTGNSTEFIEMLNVWIGFSSKAFPYKKLKTQNSWSIKCIDILIVFIDANIFWFTSHYDFIMKIKEINCSPSATHFAK
jgi:hypothetical protein